METVALSLHSPSHAGQKNRIREIALRRETINRLLWEFYGDFPLSMTEWKEVDLAPKKTASNGTDPTDQA